MNEVRSDGLVIGASGLVGRQVRREMDRRQENNRGTYFSKRSAGLVYLDATNPVEVQKFIETNMPRVLFVCISLAGGVNGCEKNPQAARKSHYFSTINIAKVCQTYGIKLIYISTDYVFDGKDEKLVNESSRTRPLNVYGEMKLEAERAIAGELNEFLIIRTTNIFGWDPHSDTPNFIMAMWQKIEKQVQFRFDGSGCCSPTHVENLVTCIFKLIDENQNGIFHIVGSESTSRLDWASRACVALGISRNLLCDLGECNSGVRRPEGLRLDTKKIVEVVDVNLWNLDMGLLQLQRDQKNIGGTRI